MGKLVVLLLWLVLYCAAVKLQQVKRYAAGVAHTMMVSTLSFYNDGSRFVTGSDDGVLNVWRLSDFSNAHTHSYAQGILHISLHPSDNRLFIMFDDGSMTVLDPDTYSVVGTPVYPGTGIGFYLRFINSNTQFILGGYDDVGTINHIWVYDCSTYLQVGGDFVTTFDNFAEITIMGVSRDGNTLAIISSNNPAFPPINMELIDIGTGTVLRTFQDNYEVLKWVLFSPHADDTLYTTTNEQNIKFYKKSPIDGEYYQHLTFFTDDYGYPNCMSAVVPDLLIFSANNKVVLLNISSNYPKVESALSDQADIFVLDISADRSYLATGMRNGQVTVWQFLQQGEDEGSYNNYPILIIIGAIVGGLVFLLLLLILIYHCCCRKTSKITNQDHHIKDQNETMENMNNDQHETRKNISKGRKSELEIAEIP